MKRRLIALAMFCAIAPATGHDNHPAALSSLLEAEKNVQNIYRAYFPDVQTGRRAAITFHAQLLESHYEAGYLVMELEREDIDKLRTFGFRFALATDFLRRRDSIIGQMQAFQASRVQAEVSGQAISIQSIPGFSCYETVEETLTVARGLVAAKPQLASLIDAGDSWEKTAGLGGHDIWVLKLTNGAITGTKPKLFVNAAIHAREYATAPLVLEFARSLVNGYGVNADATWILDHHEIHLMLQTNPDGRKKAEAGLSWRKNTNTAFCGATSNNRGVDLNRNFGFGWNATAGQGSSGNQCDLTYRGPSASSEPETRAVEAYVRSLWPDRRGPNRNDPAPADTSGIHLDIHSYSRLVLWPWGTGTTPAPNGTALQTLGRKFAFFNGYTPMQSIGLYPTDGTSDGPSYGELGVAAFTFELGNAFFESCTSFNNTIKPGNLPALLYAAKVVRSPYTTPAGPDVVSLSLSGDASIFSVPAGTPVALTASLSDARFNNSNGTEPVQAIAGAEYYLNVPPWQPGAVPIALAAADGAFNATTETVTGAIATGALAPGKHLVFVRGRDASGAWGAFSASFLNIAAGPPKVTVGLTAGRTGNQRFVDLRWSGAAGTNVDVWRNGARVLTTPNDGTQRDNVSAGSYRYRICEAGSTTACSAEGTITVP